MFAYRLEYALIRSESELNSGHTNASPEIDLFSIKISIKANLFAG
jgi:hypothetical protein